MAASNPDAWDEHVKATLRKLHEAYVTTIKPLEDRYSYDLFKPSWFEETIVNKKPFVTFFGPWSAGKTTFINHLLQSNHLWTGPQPTTAEFTVVMYGEEAGPVDGRALVNAKDMPFKGLNEFGETFMEHLKGYQCPHELLKSVTLIDTPGVLESAQEMHQRKYDYVKLSRWFTERSDMVFVMFDPTKMDAGAELRAMFKHAFRGMEGKVRIVLNKADTVNTQELMRVYGSLFWNLSNIIHTTEPPRVYIGSFWDQPYKPGTFHLLFSEEKTDLIHELTEIVPSQSLDKKVSSLIRRAKDAFVHAIIVGHMRQELPTFFGKDKAKRQALDSLQQTYERVAARFKMNWKDFPPTDMYRTFLDKYDLEKFPPLDKVDKEGQLAAVMNCIEVTLPRMLRPVKATAVADPRDKDNRRDLQDRYVNIMARQVHGEAGIQGSSDITVTGARNYGLAHNMQTASPSAGGTAQMTPEQMVAQMQALQTQLAVAQQQQNTSPAAQ